MKRSAVKVEFGGLKEVRAKVRDGDLLHTVMMWREGDEIHAECTCHQFHDAPCRHLWAVIVDADRRSYLLGGFSAGRPHLKFAPSKPGAARTAAEPIAITTPRWETPALPPLINKARRTLRAPVSTMPNRPQWEIDLIDLGQAVRQAVPPRRRILSPDKQREYYFVLDLEECALRFTVIISCRERKSDATWGKLKDAQLTWDEVNAIEDPVTGPAIRMLVGVPKIYSDHDPVPREFDLDHNRGNAVLAALAQTERLVLRPRSSADLNSCTVLKWDARPAISRVKMELDGEEWVLRSHVEVPGMKPAKITLLSRVGIMVVEDRICPLDHGDRFEWIPLLQKRGEIRVPVRHEKAFAAELMRLGPAKTVELPEHLRYAEEHPEATPVLRLLYDTTSERGVARATLECRYGDMAVTAHTPMVMNDTAARKLIYRNAGREREFRDELVAEGFRAKPAHYYDVDQRESWEIKKPRLAPALSRLIKKQWRVENDGRPFLTAGAFSARLTTGIDWFELEGEVEFAGQKVLMPELLKAVTKGDTMVALADGSIGLLPEDFLARYGGLLAMATTEGGQVRFAKSQTGLLDVFLAELPEIGADERLTKLREGIREFSGIVAEPQPEGFLGELRGYQLEGVAWMSFLERIQLG